jgi:hypothetical protein
VNPSRAAGIQPAEAIRGHLVGARTFLATAALNLVLIGPLGISFAAAPQSSEYELKAAFLFNFTQFVEWPASAFPSTDSVFTIAIVGHDPFGASLDAAVAGGLVQNRRIVVRHCKAIGEAQDCQMIFLGRIVGKDWERTRGALEHRGALTVGETPGFADHSGMIAFQPNERRLRLRINVGAARAAGLIISSKLLRLADVVGDGDPTP